MFDISNILYYLDLSNIDKMKLIGKLGEGKTELDNSSMLGTVKFSLSNIYYLYRSS